MAMVEINYCGQEIWLCRYPANNHLLLYIFSYRFFPQSPLYQRAGQLSGRAVPEHLFLHRDIPDYHPGFIHPD
jgi:hypothetical protein